MEAINLEHGFLYYYGNRAGYQKGELVYVDPIFLTSHLKEAVEARYGKSVKRQEGLYERLLACQVLDRDGKCPGAVLPDLAVAGGCGAGKEILILPELHRQIWGPSFRGLSGCV